MNEVFRKNLKYMRIRLGLKQANIARSIGYVDSIVSDFERGKKNIDSKAVKNVSKLFNVPTEILTSENLEELSKIKITKEVSRKLIDNIFPIFCSKSLENNPSAYVSYQFFESLINDQVDLIDELYEDWLILLDSVNENDEISYEIAANMLPTICLLRMISNVDDTSIQKIENNEIDLVDSIRLTNLSHKQNEETIDFNKECENTITMLIAKLKSNKNWSELGDYYIALRYLLQFERKFSMLSNIRISFELFDVFASLNNPYAIKFKSFINEFELM